jgi:hypothetical protein
MPTREFECDTTASQSGTDNSDWTCHFRLRWDISEVAMFNVQRLRLFYETNRSNWYKPTRSEYDGLIADEKQARRKALIRIGKYSAYAVPAVLALTHKAAAASIAPG